MRAAEGLSSSVQSAEPLCLLVHRLAIVLRHASAWQSSRSQPLYLITVTSPPHGLLSLCPRFSWVLSLRMSILCVCLWWGKRVIFFPLYWHGYCFCYFILFWVWGKVPLLFILICNFLKEAQMWLNSSWHTNNAVLSSVYLCQGSSFRSSESRSPAGFFSYLLVRLLLSGMFTW